MVASASLLRDDARFLLTFVFLSRNQDPTRLGDFEVQSVGARGVDHFAVQTVVLLVHGEEWAVGRLRHFGPVHGQLGVAVNGFGSGGLVVGFCAHVRHLLLAEDRLV